MVANLSPENLGLAGKKILVTGAAQGIGRATAIWLSALGAKVILSDIKDCHDAVNEAGNGAESRHLDLADTSACEDLIADLSTADSPLYGLVNCAGLLLRQNIETVTLDQVTLHNNINQTGAFFLARAVMEAMREQGQGGRIVLYTSQGAFNGGLNGSTHYAMNKAAIIALVKSMARMAGPDNITVNAVSPGAADTAMFRGGLSQEDIETFRKMIPLGRVADPTELAAPTAFLLSDWARYITGATLHVNGGQLIV